ncbi:hypothetical protein HRG_003567 [Hirsutella rhossiliensis]|uniref:Uncharacterized protein n=1 Tax=Hirsutella rhossiliensis TaxID=111463 RepID=A0A9P8SK44_9HYPO|nr:uncharacterized protein HRG_03567 [Hirsutella rhossiliensis]KAH0965551.1 hypothetical protein HRG_03567 [Hirsutella rhossiliensis]
MTIQDSVFKVKHGIIMHMFSLDPTFLPTQRYGNLQSPQFASESLNASTIATANLDLSASRGSRSRLEHTCAVYGESKDPTKARFVRRRIGLDEPPGPVLVLCKYRSPDVIFESIMSSLNKFINSVRSAYETMSDFDLASMMEGVGASGVIDERNYDRGESGTNWYHPETAPEQTETNAKMFANPFAPAPRNNSGNSNGNGGGGGDGSGGGSGQSEGRARAERGQSEGRGRGFDGPVGALKRSQSGQLLDSTGKGVSQQVQVRHRDHTVGTSNWTTYHPHLLPNLGLELERIQ